MQEYRCDKTLMKHQPVRKICVYCGSGLGRDARFSEAAAALGQAMAKAGIGLIYGGGGNGLMGELARAVLHGGGHVTGIIPESLLRRENPLEELRDLIVVRTLHERKMLMYERSDAFVALPGGLGTLEELVEQLTWVQLRHHEKPVVIANIEGYWDLLLVLLEQMRSQYFIRPGLETQFQLVSSASDIVPLLSRLWAPHPIASLDNFA